MIRGAHGKVVIGDHEDHDGADHANNGEETCGIHAQKEENSFKTNTK